ncbi:MAG TPA: hypothetical protein VNJ12_05665, partial [Candidatus Dormibacteraeota bacterium]|nr:hypothetical protein [Candidatus Dormibacteraeota bacterium]
NRRLDRTKEHPPGRITRLPTPSTRGYKQLPSAGKMMNAPHTEMLTGPGKLLMSMASVLFIVVADERAPNSFWNQGDPLFRSAIGRRGVTEAAC